MKGDGRLVCGLLDTSQEGGDASAARRARDLTVSWVRWGYFGDIFEGTTIDALLIRAADAGYDYCLIQAWGHILIEDASPNGGKSTDFFSALRGWLSHNRFVLAGVPGRCLVADLSAWQAMGRPAASSIPITSFGPELAGHLLDLKTDLSAGRMFLDGLQEQCEKASRGVFVLNYESYRDVEEPPPAFRSPVSAIYSVAAGLKPNRILQTHGFDAQTRVVFYDYSRQGLAFRRLLREEWNGRDYPRFLREAFARMPSGSTHYYLWPGATPENLDWSEMERLWTGELARWGGAEALVEHWSRFRELQHDYVLCNVLSDPEALFAAMDDRPGSVIWWSNAFATVFSATHYSLEEKRHLYERWIRGLATTAPQIFVYGSDHTNSSVNGLTAADYWERYRQQGGDPLDARRFQRHEIRF